MDTQKLIKLLNLTLSDNDPEALSAMRKANEIVRENKVLWNSLIKCPGEQYCTHTKKVPAPETSKEDSDISESIDELLESAKLKGTPRQFVESLKEYYTANGYLSTRQEEIFWQIRERTLKGGKI